jgi:hypothetical protein
VYAIPREDIMYARAYGFPPRSRFAIYIYGDQPYTNLAGSAMMFVIGGTSTATKQSAYDISGAAYFHCTPYDDYQVWVNAYGPYRRKEWSLAGSFRC